MIGIVETLKYKYLTTLEKDKVSIQKRMTSKMSTEWRKGIIKQKVKEERDT
jgi:hypothetical protein